ncbi:MAG: hypothetical protein QOF01_2022 [Thermomicrobiales bacterium]|nr:hypothetical protein [Thermomicrobiales bacterium]
MVAMSAPATSVQKRAKASHCSLPVTLASNRRTLPWSTADSPPAAITWRIRTRRAEDPATATTWRMAGVLRGQRRRDHHERLDGKFVARAVR